MRRTPSLSGRRVSTFRSVESLEPRRLLAGGVDRQVNDTGGATGTSFFTQNEPSLIVNGPTVVVGFDDSGSNAGGTNKFTGFSRSTNGGATFVDGGTLPTNAGGDAGDARIVRDPISGNLYFGTLGFSVTTLQIFRSVDNGATWQQPVNGTPGGSNEDVYGLAVDGFAGTGAGNVYLASRRFGGSPGIYFFRSVDQGASFGPSGGVLIASSINAPQGPAVVVGPDHSVYVFWYEGNTDTILLRKSTDRGLTFGPTTTVAGGLVGGTNGDLALTGRRNGTATFNSFRSNSFPRPAVNPVTGALYVVFNDDAPGIDKADVFMVQSTNGGGTWGPRVRVNDDVTITDQWQPTIAVTPDGTRLGVFYYSRQEDFVENNLYRLYGRLAGISGATVTFEASSAVSDVASFPEFGRDNVVNSTYMGDFLTAAATNGDFHVVWGDARDDLPGGAPRKDPNVYYDRIPIAPPTVTGSQYLFETLPNRITFTFSDDVGAGLATGDFLVFRSDNGVNIGPFTLSYNAATFTATLNFAAPFPAANFTAVAIATQITSGSNVPLVANGLLYSFFLPGDANRDRAVNLTDFAILAGRFNQPGTFSQGDFNYSGATEIGDFSILASRFNTTLPAASAAAAATAGAPAPAGADRSPAAVPPALLSMAAAPTPFASPRLVDWLEEPQLER